MRHATAPFPFVNVSYLTRIGPWRARTLAELARGVRACSDASLFYHTFQSLERHHYTFFSSDFAQWVRAACNQSQLSERLAAIDLRGCASFDALREAIAEPIEAHVQDHPETGVEPGYETFYFAEAIEITVPRGRSAMTLRELADGIRHMSLQTIHHHFINARARESIETNDFSTWIEGSLGLPVLAAQINRIDFYMNSLDELRHELLRSLEPWMQS